jgi:hypothetical protein
MIASAGPLVFGFDLLARQIVIGTQPPELQAFMAEHVTRIAWWLLPIPLAGSLAGLLLYPRIYRRFLQRHLSSPPTGTSPEQRADLEALFVAASLAQLPSLLGDFSVLLGARLGPALCSTTISTLSVLLIVLLGRRFV